MRKSKIKIVNKTPDAQLYRIYGKYSRNVLYATEKEKMMLPKIDEYLGKGVAIMVDGYGIYHKPFFQLVHYLEDGLPKA